MADPSDPTSYRIQNAPDLSSAWQRNCALQQGVYALVAPPDAAPLKCAAEPPAGSTARGLEKQNRQIEENIKEYSNALRVSRA